MGADEAAEEERAVDIKGDGLVYVYNDSIHDLFLFENIPSKFVLPGCINRSLKIVAIALINVAKSKGCNTFLIFSGIMLPAIRAVIVVPPENIK